MHYVLNDAREVVEEPDIYTWAKWFENAAQRVVAKAWPADHIQVSTVFIGLDHRFGDDGPPLVFETMVFGGPLDQEMEHYATWREAIAGHDAMVARVNSKLV